MNKQPALIGSSGDTLREAFGRTLSKLGAIHKDFVVFDADVAGGTGAHHFRKSHPERFFQFGIAEQNMMAAAGGFASTGIPVFVTTFAVFTLRAYEQARLSVAYSRRNVKIVASHPGLDVGPDGASAQCLEDLAAYRALPEMVVISPADPYETEQATAAILAYEGPVYMRTGRSPCPQILSSDYKFEIGKAVVLRQGTDVTLIACGVEVARALEAAELLATEGISAQVVNCSTIKPLDSSTILECARTTGAIVTAEDHNVIGGLGSAVAECLARHHPCPMEFVGIQDRFGESGEPEELVAHFGLGAPGIAAAAHRVMKRKQPV